MTDAVLLYFAVAMMQHGCTARHRGPAICPACSQAIARLREMAQQASTAGGAA